MRTAVLIAVSCCCCLPVFSQQDAAPKQAPAPAKPSSAPSANPHGRITLDVVVADKSGDPVAGLQQKDFTVLDDKKPQTIVSFQAHTETDTAGNPPLHAILLVDAVNTSDQGVMLEREELEKFLRRNSGHLSLPTSLILLGDTSTQIQPAATRDGNVLADDLNSNPSALRVITRSEGFYGAADRAQASLDALERLATYEEKRPGRKLLIWLSPGWPLLTGPRLELGPENRKAIFDAVVTLSTALRDARITLYTADPLGMADAGSLRTFYYENFLKGVTSASNVENGNLGLQVFAVQSGGRVLTSTNDVASSIATCLQDATAYYTLTFDSPPASHPNEYHSLEVKIDKPKLTARTRTGYYAQP